MRGKYLFKYLCGRGRNYLLLGGGGIPMQNQAALQKVMFRAQCVVNVASNFLASQQSHFACEKVPTYGTLFGIMYSGVLNIKVLYNCR